MQSESSVESIISTELIAVLRIHNVYPGSFLSIPDPGSNKNNKRGEGENFVVQPFLPKISHTKIENYLTFEMSKKNF